MKIAVLRGPRTLELVEEPVPTIEPDQVMVQVAYRINNAHFREMLVILHGMRTGMRLLSSGKLTLSDLVTHRFPLDQINTAFETALVMPEGFMKAVVCV